MMVFIFKKNKEFWYSTGIRMTPISIIGIDIQKLTPVTIETVWVEANMK